MYQFKITGPPLPVEAVEFLEIIKKYGCCRAPPRVWNSLFFFQNPIVHRGLLDNRWDAFLIQDSPSRGIFPIAFYFIPPEKCWRGVLVKGKIWPTASNR